MADNTSMIAGLFSSPEQYQLQQNQLAEQNAIQMAQLTPEQRAVAGLRSAGNMIGGGVGRLMGAEDPQLKLIAARQAVLRQIDQTDPDSIMRGAQALSTIDPQGASMLADAARKAASEMSQTSLRTAQAKKAQEWQQATVASERDRKVISEADVALQENKKLTPAQESNLRVIIAKEMKPKVMRDSTTGELLTIEPLDVNLAAPNVAKLLGLSKAGGVAGAGGVNVIETPGSMETKINQAEALSELTTRTKDVRSTIDETKKLISNWSTGYGNLLSSIPLTDAKTLQNNVESIKANLSLSVLQALKDASKTGASGLGQVTINEFNALQSTIAKLDPTSKSFKDDLAKIDKAYSRLQSQLETKTARAEDRAGMTAKKQEAPNLAIPGLSSSDIAPNRSPMSGLNPSLQPESAPKKLIKKWNEL
jgi:hypothetical protein